MSLEDFLELSYKMIVDPYEDIKHDEKGYIITCPDLPGIRVFGETIDEAFEELHEAKIAWFELKEELGEEVFAPELKSKPSGRLTLRLPIFLHEKVTQYSEENKTSLNNAITFLISKGLNSVDNQSLKEDIQSLASEVQDIKKQENKVSPHITINFKDEASSRHVFNQDVLRSNKKSRNNHNRLADAGGSRLFFEEMTLN